MSVLESVTPPGSTLSLTKQALREKAPAEKIRIGTIHLPSKRAYTPL
jgi:hypothetical protein